jgi:hypothetical protein
MEEKLNIIYSMIDKNEPTNTISEKVIELFGTKIQDIQMIRNLIFKRISEKFGGNND